MGIKVLILEGEQGLRSVAEQIIGRSSYVIYPVSSCLEALDVLSNNKMDVLITPVRLVGMDACGFLEKAAKIQASVQFIVFGGEEDRREAIDLMACQSVTYISTPVDPQELHIHLLRCAEHIRVMERLETEVANRRIAEEASEKALFSRITISALLETGLEPLSLERQIEVALEIILTVPRFSVLYKGALFLMDEMTGCLKLSGQINLSKELVSLCAQVPLGHCLCGKAGERREIVFVNHINEEHDTLFDGIEDHGHYCVPIVSKNRLLGVLTLYLPAGHQHKEGEDAFMTTMASTLAIIFEHRQIEADLKKAEERLRHLAYHDPLTGLRNRQSFNAVIDKIFMTMQGVGRRQKDEPLGGAFLAVLDIDHFKKVNDTYGHLMGDEVLVLFARHMKDCFRDQDALFRFGGEEFVVLLSNVSEEVAEAALNRFRHIIGSFDFPQVGQVTVSVGAIEITAGKMSGDMIEKADKALYYSKSHGRNQVNFYQTLVTAGLMAEVERDVGTVDLW